MKFIPVLIFVMAIFGFPPAALAANWWPVQSVDTMKYSRDLARVKLHDASFDAVIDRQVSQIASVGATHVAIGTPYDAEFLPFLRRWVLAARRYNINVWFRGNLSGWENWFGYPEITPAEHTTTVTEFITNNPDLFADGDIFSSCPECENGAIGDPRRTGKVAQYREFLISEYQSVDSAFRSIGKRVSANYYSANADVARLVFDASASAALDGIVVIDHYVSTPEKLAEDIISISQESGARVVLGEFGAPIPDIHGYFSPSRQAQWLESALTRLIDLPQLAGINYWVGQGGSTAIWEADGSPRPAVEVLRRFYSPVPLSGIVRNELGQPVHPAVISYHSHEFPVLKDGRFSLPFYSGDRALSVSASGYLTQQLSITDNTNSAEIIMIKSRPSILFKLRVLTRRLIKYIIP